MEPNKAMTAYDPTESIMFYTGLQQKELVEYEEERMPITIVSDKEGWEYPVKLSQDIIMQIFKFLSSKDILNVSLCNRAGFLLINNANTKFWDQYAKGVVQLNLNPGKSVLTCMINSGEREMCELVNNQFLKKVEPNQISCFQGQFYINGEKIVTGMLPAFEIRIGNNNRKQFISNWIFRKEFLPSFCQLGDSNRNNFGPTGIPFKITYFNMHNMPSFAAADKFVKDEVLEDQLFVIVLSDQAKFKFKNRNDFTTDEEFHNYVQDLKNNFKSQDCVTDQMIFESVVKDTAKAYAETLLDEEKKAFVDYMNARERHNIRLAIAGESAILGRANPVKLETSVQERITIISHPNYGKPPVQPKPVVKKVEPVPSNACLKTTIAALTVLLVAIAYFKF